MRYARNKSIVEIGEQIFKLIIKYDVIINRIPNEIKAPRNTTHDKCSTVYRIIIHNLIQYITCYMLLTQRDIYTLNRFRLQLTTYIQFLLNTVRQKIFHQRINFI